MKTSYLLSALIAVMASGCVHLPTSISNDPSRSDTENSISYQEGSDEISPALLQSGLSLGIFERGRGTSDATLSSQPLDAENMIATPAWSAVSQDVAIAPGQCWVQAVVHPKPIPQTYEVIIKDSVNKLEITPAQWGTGLTQVVTKEGTVTYRIEPPTFKEVTERVEIRPEVRRSVVVPAVFEERQDVVVVEASRTVLEPCKAAGVTFSTEAAVQALCARELPAKTQTLVRQVLVQPETTRIEVEPAEYKEIKRWVVETPARAIPVQEAPELTDVEVERLLAAERVLQSMIPAETDQIHTTRFEGEARIVSRQALCRQDLNEDLVVGLQQALKERGMDPGRIDGKLGPRTLSALLQYQRAQGLAAGALTYESLEHLGVSL
ncbi:peptidoglycan-binding domain-containing protein [Nitrincola tapanii]|uniref:Peptidoglycan binding-like domain-containing protein n=1 Tax=Nitrincola tapanii TaxID=1708751 RepID=A0A5A9W3C9_9GAMM|nr:peptidoglycan-binding domain-containing protein [Nitrincola tapanii]KAA0875246.1 hypothetical protein E1H14_04410 [Nitrincola tapanii]